jgi:hypothetical protein
MADMSEKLFEFGMSPQILAEKVLGFFGILA